MLIKKPFLLVSLVFTSCAYQAQLEQAHQKANLGQFEGAMLDYQALGAEEYTATKEKWKKQQYQQLKNAIGENPKQLCEIYQGLKKHKEEGFFDSSLSELIPKHVQESIKLSKQDLIFYAQLLKATDELLQSSQNEACQSHLSTVVTRLKKQFQPKLEKEWQDKLSKQDLTQLMSSTQLLKNTDAEDQLPKNWEKSIAEVSLKKHIQAIQQLRAQSDDIALGKRWLHYRAIKSLQGYLKQPFVYQAEFEAAEKQLFKPLVIKVEGLINWEMVQKDLSAYQLSQGTDTINIGINQAPYELKISTKPQSCSVRAYSIQKAQKVNHKRQQVDNPDWMSAKAQLSESAKLYQKKLKALHRLEEKIWRLRQANQEVGALEQELTELTDALVMARQKEEEQRVQLLQAKAKLSAQVSKQPQPLHQVFKYPAQRWEKYCELPWELSFKAWDGEEVHLSGIEYSVAQDDVSPAYHQQNIPSDQLLFDKDETALFAENQRNIEQQAIRFLKLRKDELVIALKNHYLKHKNKASQGLDNELVSLYLLSDTAMNITLALQMSKDETLVQDQALIAKLQKTKAAIVSQQMLAKIEKEKSDRNQQLDNQQLVNQQSLSVISQRQAVANRTNVSTNPKGTQHLQHKINKPTRSESEADIVELNEIVIEGNR
jgi:hypothetical protein